MEHHFNIDIAKDYGIEEAILLHNFFFWIAKNAANGENFHDGLFWTYNTRDSYAKLFKYMSDSKIYRIIGNLVDKKLLVKGDYNTDRWKRPTWYAFTNDGLKYMAKNGYDIKPFGVHFQNDTNDCSKMNNRACQNEQSIIINNTDSKTNKDKDKENYKKEKEEIDAFVEKIYSMYPTKCPVRKASLGKSYKDKDRIRRLLKTYSTDDIIRVVKNEVEEKYGKQYMSNFSTFLNNFPDPNSLFAEDAEHGNGGSAYPQGYWQ